MQYALKGVFLLLKTERNFQIQCIAAIVVTAFGFYFEISNEEWMFQIIAIALVLGAEAMNTAFEKLADYVMPNHNEKIGIAKDISAAAVLICALFAAIIGLFIYLPKVL